MEQRAQDRQGTPVHKHAQHDPRTVKWKGSQLHPGGIVKQKQNITQPQKKTWPHSIAWANRNHNAGRRGQAWCEALVRLGGSIELGHRHAPYTPFQLLGLSFTVYLHPWDSTGARTTAAAILAPMPTATPSRECCPLPQERPAALLAPHGDLGRRQLQMIQDRS